MVAEARGIEATDFAADDHAGNRHRLPIKLAFEAVELRGPNFLGGAQRDLRKALPPWFDQHHAFAAAEREPAQPAMPASVIAALIVR